MAGEGEFRKPLGRGLGAGDHMRGSELALIIGYYFLAGFEILDCDEACGRRHAGALLKATPAAAAPCRSGRDEKQQA